MLTPEQEILTDNPVHQDMNEAAKLAKVDFIVNVVENKKGEIVKAFAGDLEQAFLEAVKLVDEMFRVTVERRADILVVSAGGYPSRYKSLSSLQSLRQRFRRC